MGIAAPRIGIARAAAVVHSRGNTPAIILLNPQITTRTDELDEQYEGCLSFRCVRRFVLRVMLTEMLPLYTDARAASRISAAYVLEALYNENIDARARDDISQRRVVFEQLIRQAIADGRISPATRWPRPIRSSRSPASPPSSSWTWSSLRTRSPQSIST
ncbi:peptide deformylase [Streptomyces sp. NPDC059152]|uniref:peptide deformylase n=1 Tax=Streptomyces sp. NPDC059152 TaxID=3346742 RepID=UPI0036BF05F4